MRKVIKYKASGGLGNRMFEYMFAHTLQRHIPRSVLTGDSLQPWGIELEQVPFPARHLSIQGHRIELQKIVYLLQAGVVDGVLTNALACRMEFLRDPELFRPLFRDPKPAQGFGADELVINIRAAEIMDARHKDYSPLPVSFYKELVSNSGGLKPVFMGQTDDTPYLRALRDTFPDAPFLPSQGAMEDFSIIRHSQHICVSVSTFSWLAAWLSRAQTIHLPLSGMFNPLQRGDVNLVPLGDRRYQLHQFPANPWQSTEEQMQALISGDNPAQILPHDAIAQSLHKAVLG